MSKRHKHADVIIAWAEGAEIECRGQPSRGWITATNPDWNEEYEYRVKPPPAKYRVALLKDSSKPYALATNDQAYADIIEQREDFVRWLTDWIEYEEWHHDDTV